MKGIILAGGTGSRLRPVTFVVNKNILPVYNQPSIFYSVDLLRTAGIKEIAIIAEYHYLEDFITILGNGTDFGVKLEYISDTPYKKGPASAIYYAKDFIDGEFVAVVFADGIYDLDISEDVKNFSGGAVVYLKEVDNPSQFGIHEMNKDGKIISIEEKPERPKSNLAYTGLTLYDEKLVDYIEMIKPGPGGEYYTVDVNKIYLESGTLEGKVITEFWQDIGTFDGLLSASNYMKERSEKRGQKNIERISFKDFTI